MVETEFLVISKGFVLLLCSSSPNIFRLMHLGYLGFLGLNASLNQFYLPYQPHESLLIMCRRKIKLSLYFIDCLSISHRNWAKLHGKLLSCR